MPADPTPIDEQYTQDFARELARAGETFHTEPTALIDSAWVVGRRLRRRRRASMAAGAAALALIGVGGVALGSGAGSPSVVGAASEGGTAAPKLSGEQVLALLTELLPAGTTEVGEARGTETDTTQIRMVHDDGNGAGQLLFWITPTAVGPDHTCPNPPIAGDACTATTLPDGSDLVVYQAGTRAGEPAGSKTWAASLYSANGYTLMIQEWNRKPLERGTPITRTDPLLNTGQLAAVATDARWRQVAASLAPAGPKPSAPPASPGGQAPSAPSEVVASALASLAAGQGEATFADGYTKVVVGRSPGPLPSPTAEAGR
ncbi:hypothetical protein ACIGZJ_11730 [Kitasatospora sp. NPDC052868]|uniref:hypothetical protein n=1 Tax=Kitasatospora sp. NPDC052868 TaxID=3364060 RepID=UPI0037C91D99